MARIQGVDVPNEKRADIGLTYLFGVGRSNVIQILEKANIEPEKRIKDLTEDEISRITKALDAIMIE